MRHTAQRTNRRFVGECLEDRKLLSGDFPVPQQPARSSPTVTTLVVMARQLDQVPQPSPATPGTTPGNLGTFPTPDDGEPSGPGAPVAFHSMATRPTESL